MAEYGQPVGDGMDMEKLDVYNYFIQYFNNPEMQKLKELKAGYVMYCCKVKSMLSKDKKYIFVIVSPDQDPGTPRARLNDLNWEVLQTRTIEDSHNVPLHDYRPKSTTQSLRIFEKRDDMYKYTCHEFPNIIVSLLFTKNQTRVYGDRGDLDAAIETYNTIIAFI